MQGAMARHDEILRDAIEGHGGATGGARTGRERVRSTLAATIPPSELEARGRAMSRDDMRRFALGEYDAIDAVAEKT